MKKILLLLIILFSITSAYAQHYTLHSATKGVKIESGGKVVDAVAGMTLKATDCLIIPEGATADVLNGLDKRIYTSVRPGRVSVTRLMIEARKVASDNTSSVANKMRFGKKTENSNRRVFVEKGVVNRSLAVYDPEGDAVAMDPVTLAAYILSKIGLDDSALPIGVTHGSTPDGKFCWEVDNTAEYPVYFNILRVYGDEVKQVEVSQMGQPNGGYVLLPGQTLTMKHPGAIADSERHVMVLTPCSFELDAVIEAMGKGLSEGNAAVNESVEIPASVVTF